MFGENNIHIMVSNNERRHPWRCGHNLALRGTILPGSVYAGDDDFSVGAVKGVLKSCE